MQKGLDKSSRFAVCLRESSKHDIAFAGLRPCYRQFYRILKPGTASIPPECGHFLTVSGGQLKRVSLAVELVANPNILFLDEITGGLDAGTDKHMVHLLADLAADEKTVICVTHTLENIDVCHQVVLLHKGKLGLFRSSQRGPPYFGVQRLSDVYELLEASPADLWADKFRASSYYRTYVLDRCTHQLD